MKEQIKEIIESYCEGITFLEFRADDLDEMTDKILALQLQQTGVISELKSCTRCNGDGSYKLPNNLDVICGVCDGKGKKEDFNYL